MMILEKKRREEGKPLRIAAFGFRALPPRPGSAGACKFASELYPRLVQRGHAVIAYNRSYGGKAEKAGEYRGVQLVSLTTIKRSGFDTLVHSWKCTLHIIRNNTADIVHIHNGGNSIWAILLRFAGKRVFVSQDGVDWKRDKWPWYAKLFLYVSSYITAFAPNRVIFDNIFSRELFEGKFGKKFDFIPYGSEVPVSGQESDVLERLGLETGKYLLFVGRFIPDKGIHYLVRAFERVDTNFKLVLVGGSPNPSEYEQKIRKTTDSRIIFPGYIYGDDTITLMRKAYAYIQPSDVEGLSPVILTVMGLATPLICSDIPENQYAVGDTAITFIKSDIESLADKITFSINNEELLLNLAKKSQQRALTLFNWESITDQHVQLFRNE